MSEPHTEPSIQRKAFFLAQLYFSSFSSTFRPRVSLIHNSDSERWRVERNL